MAWNKQCCYWLQLVEELENSDSAARRADQKNTWGARIPQLNGCCAIQLIDILAPLRLLTADLIQIGTGLVDKKEEAFRVVEREHVTQVESFQFDVSVAQGRKNASGEGKRVGICGSWATDGWKVGAV